MGSPYEAPGSCGSLVPGGPQARPGQCFDIAPPTFCGSCDATTTCSSGWTPGYNVDPNVNGGQPFQEQEWGIRVSATDATCTVTCNPGAADPGCPRGWSCTPLYATCLTDADCNGVTCEGEDLTLNPPRPGACLCGDNGAPFATCPSTYPRMPAPVTHPRCVVRSGGDMFCAASFGCTPPPAANPYPAACFP